MLWREIEKIIHLHDLHIEVFVEVLNAFMRFIGFMSTDTYRTYAHPHTPRLLLAFTSMVQIIDSIFAHYFLLIVVPNILKNVTLHPKNTSHLR